MSYFFSFNYFEENIIIEISSEIFESPNFIIINMITFIFLFFLIYSQIIIEIMRKRSYELLTIKLKAALQFLQLG